MSLRAPVNRGTGACRQRLWEVMRTCYSKVLAVSPWGIISAVYRKNLNGWMVCCVQYHSSKFRSLEMGQRCLIPRICYFPLDCKFLAPYLISFLQSREEKLQTLTLLAPRPSLNYWQGWGLYWIHGLHRVYYVAAKQGLWIIMQCEFQFRKEWVYWCFVGGGSLC